MGFTIDSILSESYGLYITTSEGHLNLPESKEQFYVAYGYEGYQITKRKGNDLEVNGFIIADNMADFKAKTAALKSLFSAPGLRIITDNNGNVFNCFCKEGFSIDKVYVYNQVFARIKIKLTIV